MPRVAVVVAWRPGCEHRHRAWQWVKSQYANHHPDWEVIEAHAPAGAWCKAAAVMPAVAETDAQVVLLADADVWCDQLAQAADLAATGRWVVPHTNVHRLTPEATVALIAGNPGPHAVCERPYRGIVGGGIIAAPRDLLLDIPMDPRFIGWGQEDQSHGIALHFLAGPCARGTSDLWHLWHPPQNRFSRKVGSIEGQMLHRRYLKARRDPAAMRALIEEAKRVSHHAHQPAVRDRSPRPV